MADPIRKISNEKSLLRNTCKKMLQALYEVSKALLLCLFRVILFNLFKRFYFPRKVIEYCWQHAKHLMFILLLGILLNISSLTQLNNKNIINNSKHNEMNTIRRDAMRYNMQERKIRERERVRVRDLNKMLFFSCGLLLFFRFSSNKK